MSSNGQEPADRFPLHYLPPAVAGCFGEALGCYGHGLWKAFGAMCRLTAAAMFAETGEPGRLRAYDLVQEVQSLAQVDEASFSIVRRLIFDDQPAGSPPPDIGRYEAALLLETMKDLLHQVYVRRARLQAALKVRRFFAEQHAG